MRRAMRAQSGNVIVTVRWHLMTLASSGGIGLQDSILRDFHHRMADGDMRFLGPADYGGRYQDRIVTTGQTISSLRSEEPNHHQPSLPPGDQRCHEVGGVPRGGQSDRKST